MSAGSEAGEYGNPLGLSPAEWAAHSHYNAGPKLIACCWALAGPATVFLALRVYCRLLKGQRLWWDDVVLIASWACVIVDAALLTYAATLGYGRHIWDFDFRNLQALVLPMNVAGTFSIVAAVWSKTSFGITLLKITDGWLRRVTWFCLVSMNIFMGLTALFVWVNCTPVRKTWDVATEGKCWPNTVTIHYNMFSATYSAAMDLVLACLPWKFLWGLQMKRKEKIGVAVAMSMGLFAGLTGIVKAVMMPRLLSIDFAESVDVTIWGHAESCLSIIAASIPVLRVLVRDAKSSRQYASRSGYAEQQTGTTTNGSRSVTITSRANPPASDVELDKLSDHDGGSDRSILGATTAAHAVGQGRVKHSIVQVTDFSVQYEEGTEKS